jgi:molybdopterin synthase catalytic subunit
MHRHDPAGQRGVRTAMIELTTEPIDVAKVLAEVTHPECGAEVLFLGTTRQWTVAAPDRLANAGVDPSDHNQAHAYELPPSRKTGWIETSHLIYEAYVEMATAEMRRLQETAQRRWPVRKSALVHRLGQVEPTQPSVAVAVSCPHRSEAFEAAQWLINELKHRVPIWKQEHFVQTGPEWIHPTAGQCRCDHASSPVWRPETRQQPATAADQQAQQ